MNFQEKGKQKEAQNSNLFEELEESVEMSGSGAPSIGPAIIIAIIYFAASVQEDC